jgi:hypothetical protein
MVSPVIQFCKNDLKLKKNVMKGHDRKLIPENNNK